MTTTATRPGVTDLGRRASALAIRCRDNPDDREAWDELIAAVGRLVGQRACLRAFRSPRFDLDDLMQEGFLGVMRAARDFDPDRSEFTTRAVSWIDQRICRFRDVAAPPVRLPAHARESLSRWRRTGRPDDAEMERVDRICSGSAALDAIPEPAGRDERDPTDPDEVARLRAAVDRLAATRPELAEAFRRHHGLFGRIPEMHREIAPSLGVSASRVQQMTEAAMRFVTRAMKAERGAA